MDSDIKSFQKEVWAYYRAYGRHDLPWRKTKDAYKILVSEVMLQQTQVPRVLEKYKEFLRAFPAVEVLANAKLSDVLKVWSGLGYNRRGKYLHDAAKKIVDIGNIKKALTEPLPGVGPYTRAAVRTFAYNEPHTMIETNIRAAFIHHFFHSRNINGRRQDGNTSVHDRDLIPLIEKAAQDQDPREWHWALMDYGSYLKKQFPNPSRKSADYRRQSKFEGSLRQIRGAILQELHAGPQSEGKLLARLNLATPKSDFGKRALAGLEKDGMIEKVKGKWRIS